MKAHVSLLVIITALLNFTIKAQPYAASNLTLISLTDPETTVNSDGQKYSGCWGWYQISKNKEYAIACSHQGTYWIDISNPSSPTVSAYQAGKKTDCTWREAKSYQNHLYVISDDFGNNSFQIFDMSYLPDSVHKVYDGTDLFERGHAAWVDQNKLYIASVTDSIGYSSMNVYSLADPGHPVLLRKLGQDFPFITEVHDMYVRNDTVYASCGYQGLYIFKLTSGNTFSMLGSLSNYPFSGYNHSSALTPNGQTLIFTDEIPVGLPIKIADVSNLGNIQVQATINQFSQTTPHNPFIVNNQYCFVSSYQDGIQLIDISNPATPFLAGYFDTHPQSGGNNNIWLAGSEYNGQWGAYPFFPSGVVFALDRLNGVFLLHTSLYQAPLISPGFSGSDTVCVNGTIQFTNTSTGANTFTWVAPGGVISNTNALNASISYTAPGTYSVMLFSANSSYSASSTQTLSVTNPILSVVSVTHSTCQSCATGIISVVSSGGSAPYTYSWTPDIGNTATLTGLLPGCYTVSIKDFNHCTSYEQGCVFFPSYFRNIPATHNQISVYPNPAQTVMTVTYPDEWFTYSVYDCHGKLVLSSEKKFHTDAIPVHEYQKGIYLIKIQTDKTINIQKIILN